MQKQTDKIKESILKDPSASYWLQKAIVQLDERDLVDAMRDVELLLLYLKHRIEEVIENKEVIQ